MFCKRTACAKTTETHGIVSRENLLLPLTFYFSPLIFFLAAPSIYSPHLFSSDENNDSDERKEKKKKEREIEGLGGS